MRLCALCERYKTLGYATAGLFFTQTGKDLERRAGATMDLFLFLLLQFFGEFDGVIDTVDIVGLAFVALDDIFVGFMVGKTMDVFVLVLVPLAIEFVLGDGITVLILIVEVTIVDVFLDKVVDVAATLDAVLPESAFAGIVGNDKVDVGIDFVHNLFIDFGELFFHLMEDVIFFRVDLFPDLLCFVVGEVNVDIIGIAVVHTATADAEKYFAFDFVIHNDFI